MCNLYNICMYSGFNYHSFVLFHLSFDLALIPVPVNVAEFVYANCKIKYSVARINLYFDFSLVSFFSEVS